MPILQSRLLTIIRAGQDYQRALRRLQRMLTEAETEATALRATDPHAHARALQQLILDSQEIYILSNPLQSGRVLDIEAERFTPRAVERNKKAKARIAKLRLEGRIPRESTSPDQQTRRQNKGGAKLTRATMAALDEEARQAEIDEQRRKEADESGALVMPEEGQSGEED